MLHLPTLVRYIVVAVKEIVLMTQALSNAPVLILKWFSQAMEEIVNAKRGRKDLMANV